MREYLTHVVSGAGVDESAFLELRQARVSEEVLDVLAAARPSGTTHDRRRDGGRWTEAVGETLTRAGQRRGVNATWSLTAWSSARSIRIVC